MSKKSVLCIASSEKQVERIANELKAAGFSGTDISVLFPDKTGTRDFAHEQHTKAPEGAATGAGTGGVVGGGLGWLIGIGALAGHHEDGCVSSADSCQQCECTRRCT